MANPKAMPSRGYSDLSAVTFTSPIGDTATIESARTVHSLEAELVKLRESTKDALTKAWEEVESLQQQCASHLEITSQLEADFMETKKKEQYWHKRCLEAEKQLLQCKSNESSPASSKRSLIVGSDNNFLPWGRQAPARQYSQETVNSRFSVKSTITEEMASARSLAADEEITELKMKLASRESAVQSLERTVSQHVKAMHTMQAEMQCMMETQRIKEKNAQANYIRKEDVMTKQVSTLKQALERKTKQVSTLKKQLNKSKEYIKEVTEELERALKHIKPRSSKRKTRHKPGTPPLDPEEKKDVK